MGIQGADDANQAILRAEFLLELKRVFDQIGHIQNHHPYLRILLPTEKAALKQAVSVLVDGVAWDWTPQRHQSWASHKREGRPDPESGSAETGSPANN